MPYANGRLDEAPEYQRITKFSRQTDTPKGDRGLRKPPRILASARRQGVRGGVPATVYSEAS